ncbi:hypothetical protein C8E01_102322 [Pontibacter virosus]|uniref:Uncharacterized protein n=1 Tax=Pontibacter virosus TaxID=1765052 RepID=A0A2U1B394_9BACT|nr:hypothetical protein C8E01_102322 [Pontibacter virosus]
MDYLYDYISQLDVRTLSAGEVSQCLFYLHQLSKQKPEIRSSPVMNKPNERLNEQRKQRINR